MGSKKALTLAGVLVAGAIHSASAADLLPPPPVLDAPLRGTVVEASGFYLRGDVGVGIAGSTKLRQSFDAGFAVPGLAVDSEKRGDQAFIGLGVGYRFNNWFRADLTGEYRSAAGWNAVASYTCASLSGRCYDHYNGRVANSVFLANAYADLGTWSGLTPFLGVGLGTAQHRFQSLTDADYQLGGFGYAKDKDSWKFAWALMAGLGYDVSPNLKLELGYRYLNMGKATSGNIVCQNTAACGNEVQKVAMSSHDIRLGMRWMLSDTPVAPMPAPLVRKY